LTGTLINIIAVLFGGLLGSFLGARLPDKMRETVMSGLGLVTAVVGMQMALGTHNILLVMGSVLVGGVLGEWWRIEDGLEAAGRWLEERVGSAMGSTDERSITRAFVTASLVFCVGPLTILGWRWNGRFAVIAYLIPVGYCLAGLVLIVVVGLGGFPDTAYLHQAARSFGFGPIPDGAAVALLVALQGSAGMIYSVATAAGEELGWRGFLVPELARKLSFTPVAVLSGLVWATWHYPVFALLFPPGNGVPMWFSLPTFTSAAVAVSFAQAWLRLRTDSVWPPIVLHASHNVWMQAICTPLIIEKPSTKWVAGEPGLVFVALSALVAAVFWAKRKELTEPKAASSSPIQTGIDDDGRRSE